MARRHSKRAAPWRRTMQTASTLVIAGFAATGCESEVDRSSVFLAAQVQPAAPPVAAPAPAAPHNVAKVAPPDRTAAPPGMIATAPVPELAPMLDFPPLAGAGLESKSELAVIEPSGNAEPEQAIAAVNVEASPQAAVGLFEVDSPMLGLSEVAYVPQISDSVRAAYIAQVDAAQPGQRMAVRAGDQLLGEVQFQVVDGVVSVHIGQVLDLFEAQMDTVRFAELRSSSSAAEFVSLDRLQGAGIPLDYNAAYDELTLDSLGG
ncbi:hypothetical protein ACWPM1_07975 [Tsuneonella sp. HG249]